MPDREPCRESGYVLDVAFLNEAGLCEVCEAIAARKNEEGWREP